MPKNCDTCKYDLFRLCGEEDKTPCDDCYNGNPPTKWEPGENYEPMTKADRIRAMSDEELATFVAEKIVNIENQKMIEQGHTPTATQLSALGHTMYCTLMRWLREPAEGE